MASLTYKLYNTTGLAFDKVKCTKTQYLFEYPCKNRSLCEPYVVLLNSGNYKIELWGASGGNARKINSAEYNFGSAGNGSYVKGNIFLQKPTQLFIYLGGQGEDLITTDNVSYHMKGGWNFGGNGGNDYHDAGDTDPPESGAGGGGGVDVRLEYYDINEEILDDRKLMRSIKSRIIVAGSGGGAEATQWPFGKPGGKLAAINSTDYILGGTQTLGMLGKGMDGLSSTNNMAGSGGSGSGYRGGYIVEELAAGKSFAYGGAGGSSYISGHESCISPSPDPDSNESDGTSIHFSGLFFTSTQMLAGDEQMIDPSGSKTKGHFGNGVCRITKGHFMESLIQRWRGWNGCCSNRYSMGSSQISAVFGQEKFDECNQVVCDLYRVSIILGLIVPAILIPINKPLSRWFKANEETVDMVFWYIIPQAAGNVFTCIFFTNVGFLQAEGRTLQMKIRC